MVDIFSQSVDLCDLGLIKVYGKNPKQFLQGLLTCDLETIHPLDQCHLGAHCDAKGRVLASFHLFLYQDNYYLLLPSRMLQILLSSLRRYAIFSKVSIMDVSAQWQKIGVYGFSHLEELQYSPLGSKLRLHDLNPLILKVAGSIPRFILFFLNQKKTTTFLCEKTTQCWQLFDILIKLPTIYPETSLRFTPHQLNYPRLGGLSFNKGCYIGQEIIARTHYLGKSKSQLYRVQFQANKLFPPGTPLTSGNKAEKKGTLINCAYDKTNKQYQALVCLQKEAVSSSINLEGAEGPLLQFVD